MTIAHTKKIVLIICALLITIPFSAFSSDSDTKSTTPEPYAAGEFPNWATDLRRTEIISFGSLPFVTLGVTLGLGGYWYLNGDLSSFPNPFNKSSSSYTADQQVQIIEVSAIISIGLGLTDLIINTIQRNNTNKKLQRIQESKEKMSVTPLTPEEAGALIKKNTPDDSSIETEQINTDTTDVEHDSQTSEEVVK